VKQLSIIILLLVSYKIAFSQKQFNNWYCGYGAGMTFNSGSPTIITPNPMYTDDNSATISDANGNLLFFANGTTAYDRNGNVMPNGNGLYGNSTAGQTATIVQMPGSNTKYYLFTMDAMAGPNGATYSVVDMTLNGGLGDIVSGQKNITILAPATEKMEPIRHANGVDVWIVIHEWNTDAYRAYLLTSTGLSTTPVITHIGTVATGGFSPGYNAMGQLVVNDANNMLAAAVFSDGNIQLFDFDNSTGILSNTVLIPQTKAFGLQFSPNGNLLYATSWTLSTIYQYDLSTYTAAAISASQVNLGTCDGEGYLETGPDGKIYVAKWQTNYIGVINSPNSLGTTCNFVDQGFYTGTYESSAGLVDKILVNSVCDIHVHLGNDTTICNGGTIILKDTFSNASSLWSTGDTTPSITVTATGTYWLQVTQGTCKGRDTIHIAVSSAPPAFSLGADTTYCGSFSRTLSTGNTSTLWSTGVIASSITVTAPGTYWATITNSCGIATDTIHIAVSSAPPAFSLGADTTYCGSFSRTLSTGNTSTLWSTGVIASSITVTAPGTYWATITNSCGTATDTIHIHQNPIPMVNLGSDTNICNSNPLTLDATTAGATYLWQNGTTAPTLTISTSGIYWVDVSLNGCDKRDSIAVSYINPLSFNIGKDTTYCGSFIRVLTAGVAHTIWSTGDTATSITVDTPGLYWGRVTACGDTLADSITISERPLPVVDLGPDTTLCIGTMLTLDAAQDSASYLWIGGTKDSTFTVSAAGTYWVAVTVDQCSRRDSISVSYIGPPGIIGLGGGDTTICQDSSLILNVYQPAATYHWSTGDTTSSIIASQSGLYSVTVSNTCGSYTASESITVDQCTCRIAIPNAFSPNNDGKNDSFYVLTQCPLKNFRFDIYNRWGQKLFMTNNVTDKWDGTYKGAPQPLGVYVYFLRYTDPYTNRDISQSGNVTLLR
jgi:gliding motility-associated-like protein